MDIDALDADEDSPPPPDQRVGRLDIPGMTGPLVGELFEHAADFYRAQPWVSLDEEDIFAAKYGLPGQTQHEYVICVMGMGGMEFGLALFDTVTELNASLAAEVSENPAAVVKTSHSMSLTFTEEDELGGPDFTQPRGYWRYFGPGARHDQHWHVEDHQRWRCVYREPLWR